MINIYAVRKFCYAIRNFVLPKPRIFRAGSINANVIALTRLMYCA